MTIAETKFNLIKEQIRDSLLMMLKEASSGGCSYQEIKDDYGCVYEFIFTYGDLSILCIDTETCMYFKE